MPSTSGALTKLVCRGPQDVALTGNPTTTNNISGKSTSLGNLDLNVERNPAFSLIIA